jgi:hypothetical protein
MTRSKQSLLVLLAFAVASLATQSLAARSDLAAKPLGAHAIHTALAQNTVSMTIANGSIARVYLAPHGALRGTYDGKKVKGHWSIKNNMLCLRYPQMRDNGCWSVLRYPDGRLQLFDATGTPAGDLGVSQGDPHDF